MGFALMAAVLVPARDAFATSVYAEEPPLGRWVRGLFAGGFGLVTLATTGLLGVLVTL